MILWLSWVILFLVSSSILFCPSLGTVLFFGSSRVASDASFKVGFFTILPSAVSEKCYS